MNYFTEQEVLAAFQKLGLATDEDRAKFTQYSLGIPQEDIQEFIYLDTTQVIEANNAELA